MKKRIREIKEFIKLYLDKFSKTPKYYPIQLTISEQNTLISILKNTKNYLEFGAGGSTFLALLHSNAKITTVESDLNWINFIKTWNILKTNVNKRLNFCHVDIGKIIEWGYPQDIESNKNKLPNYSKIAFENLNNTFDTVLVDGRFRVACVLQTILHCDKETTILIHDFFDRPQYHIILEFLDVVDSVDNLGILKIKENINKKEIFDLYQIYQYIPA